MTTAKTAQESKKIIPSPTGFNFGSTMRVAIKSNRTRNGAIPTTKTAAPIKRKTLPTLCTVVSGFAFTSAICANPQYPCRLLRSSRHQAATRINPAPQDCRDRGGGDDAAGDVSRENLRDDQSSATPRVMIPVSLQVGHLPVPPQFGHLSWSEFRATFRPVPKHC